MELGDGAMGRVRLRRSCACVLYEELGSRRDTRRSAGGIVLMTLTGVYLDLDGPGWWNLDACALGLLNALKVEYYLTSCAWLVRVAS